MERIKSLNSYQKGILIFMIVMAFVFAMIYPKTISRVGYRYNDAILVPTQENGTTLYSGEIKGQQACFAVSDNIISFQYGDKTYGPYTIKEDPTAIPKNTEMSEGMKGIEMCEGNDILFRGGVRDLNDYYMFYNEDGTTDNMIIISYVTSDGIERDENGNPIDKMKPTISTIYELNNNPELTHKGYGFAWFGALFICILNAISILFADELFRLNLVFQIRNVEHAEPSDWEISKRYIEWTTFAIIALVIFILGLQ